MRWAVVAVGILLLLALLWFRRLPDRAPTEIAIAAVPVAAGPPGAEPVVEAPVEPDGPVLRGTVFLPNGSRADHAILHANLTCDSAPAPSFAFAEDDGSFVIRVRPDTARSGVDLVVEHPRSETPRNVFALSGEQVGAGTVEIVLTSMTVSGRAVDRDGRPVPYATVELLADTPPSHWYAQSREDLLCCFAPQADREGRFSVRVQQRRLRAVVRAPGLSPGVRWVGWPQGNELGDVVLASSLP